ncbi:uncharacterized protein LOC123260348 [Cotesia glomerata]|uniref:uncharacterized protein LOC123260348 n=1 Tax=Cotesia glomerata TaxID=32391 RepID=UPI001D00B84B|nr:uncharacterized protein LOC123260348 [Cotesia glomerata]
MVITLVRIFNWAVVMLTIVATAVDFFINIDNFQEVSYNLNYMFPLLMVEFKSVVIYLQQNKFRRLIDDIYEPISLLKYSSGFIRWINVQLIILQANFRHCDDITTSRASLSVSQQNYNIIQAYRFLKVPEEQEKIRSFVPFTLEEANVAADSFLLRFQTCVIHHRRLINNLNDCNSSFSFVLFGQILTSCILICVGLFTLAMVSISSTFFTDNSIFSIEYILL